MMLISIKALRCHVFFVYSVIILCYGDFYEIFNKKLPKTIDNTKEIIILALIAISTISHLYDYKFINRIDKTDYPYQMVEFIKENNIKGNVFVNFHDASYVIYKLYPNNHIFMDGRYEEVYDNELINKMANFFLAKDYRKFLNEFHHDILIIDNSYPIKKALNKDNDWFLAFENKKHSLYLNKKMIP